MTTQLKYIENELIILTKILLRESGNVRAADAIHIDALLDSELGIGSLERTELFLRIEKKFSIRLPDTLISEAESLRDLVMAIQKAQPANIHPIEHKQVEQLSASSLNLDKIKTLPKILFEYNEHVADRPHIYLAQDDGSEKIIRYGDLYQNAKLVANGLHTLGLKAGETVAIMLPTNEDFFYAFFGVLLAGGVPVPIYPPFRANLIEEYAKREAKILQNAEVRFLITFSEAETLSRLLKAFITSLKGVATIEMLKKAASNKRLAIKWKSSDIALIQYTSGSTGDPKGVVLTHANLLTNIRAYGKAIQIKPTDVAVSWLPLYHDMGLIGAWLGSFYHGIPLALLSPLQFLARPERWLWTIHTHRGTLSAGPNFAYDLCVRKIDEKVIEGLDLSSWRLAFNGAETIYPKTIREFTQHFSRYGFKTTAFFPVYGLAENSLALTFPKLNRAPHIERIDRYSFEVERKAIETIDGKDSLEFVGCGSPLPEHMIRIVDDNNNPLSEREIGKIQFRGPSAMQGYYHNSKATKVVFHDGWWDSGDLGYLANNELYLTGRAKDIIIKSGRNLFPAEIEELVTATPEVRRGCIVAFSISNPKTGTEKFIIVAETREKDSKKQQKIIKEINKLVNVGVGLPPDEVILTLPGQIPKTSSGKLRRADCKKFYLEDRLHKRHLPVWLQAARLSWRAFINKAKYYFLTGLHALYSSYAILLFFFMVVSSWAMSFLLPKFFFAKYIKITTRMLLILIGIPVKVINRDNLTKAANVIFVSNHASYTDTLILLSVLPTNALFIGKKELLTAPLLKRFIYKLNHIMVDRLDFSKSQFDLEKMNEALQANSSIIIFPEGTFTYATGLRPFKLGGFKLAIETQKPLCAIAIKGSRNFLRSGSWLLKPSKISLTVGELIHAKDNNWQEIIRLKDECRLFIAAHCGEPTLDLISAGYKEDQSR